MTTRMSNRPATPSFEYKQVIVVRQDLKMTKGKLAVQVAHGAVTAAEHARSSATRLYNSWLMEGQKKVVAKVESTKELIHLRDLARDHNLSYAMIQDAGLTELSPGTITVLAIGPGLEKEIDRVTGELKLL